MRKRATEVASIILVVNVLILFMCGMALASKAVGLKGHDSLIEIFLYKGFADQVFSGKVPYRDFLIEYPILSLPLFLFPRLLASSPGGYAVGFVSQMLCINSAIMWVLARSGEDGESPNQRLWWYGAAVVCLSPLAVARFDLAPALLTLIGVRFANCSKYASSGAAIGLGILTKASPALALVTASLHAPSRASRLRLLVSATNTTLGGLAIWWIIAGSNMIAAIAYHADRGLQIESIYATALATLGFVWEIPAKLTFRYGCDELAGAAASLVANFVFPFQILALGLVTAQIWRRRIGLWAGTCSLLLTFALFGKVFSPQYLLWILPLLALTSPTQYPRVRSTR